MAWQTRPEARLMGDDPARAVCNSVDRLLGILDGGCFWSVLQRRKPGWMSLFALFGVPFVLVGLGMLTSPYWLYKKAKQTVYALTNRRAMIITGGSTKKVQSFTGNDIGIIERTERSNGIGDVVFATVVGKKSDQPVGFMGISEARRVERLLLDTFKKDKETKDDLEPTSFSNQFSRKFD